MSREYRHIQQYEKEILELKAKGYTNREIGEKEDHQRIMKYLKQIGSVN